QSDNSLLVPLRIWRADDLLAHQRQEAVMLGVLYGMLGLAALAGLVFYAQLREPAYLYYALLVASFGLYDAISEGMLGVFLWPSPIWSGRWLHVAGVVGVFAHLFFVRRFLSTPVIAPRLDRIPVLALPLAPILVLWPFVADVQAFIRVAVFAVGVATAWTLAVEAVGLARGTRPARFFLLACIVLLASLIPYMLRAFGAASTSALTEFGIELGILLAASTLWVGLADQLKRRSAELRDLNVSLEERIRARTAELEETSRELARANDAKRDFLATASHDLRQPLHALNLLIGALEARVQEPAARELLGPVEQSAQGVGEMLDSLLDLSKLDAGVLEADVGDLPLAPILSRLERELAESAARKGLALRIEPSARVVRSDPLLLQRILQNLLTNAIRYTDRGHVAVSVGGDDESVRIRVEDSGRGIPEAMRRRIFESYARLEPGDDATREAMGLGLSIVRRLADLLDHGLDVEPNPGGGSVFTLRVAAGEDRPVALPVAGFDGARILVVDPDPDTRAGLCELLASWDCRPVGASAPAEVAGCLAAEAGPPSAFVADFASGGASAGLDELAGLRGELSGIAGIVLSADSTREAFERARERGLVLLRKPLAPARLRAALAHALRESRG
nr:7TM diverse intracellular signaling domain-containing protein [Myxococcota bacterium]